MFSGWWLQEDRKVHYEGLKQENDKLIGRINGIRAAQAEQESKVAKVRLLAPIARQIKTN